MAHRHKATEKPVTRPYTGPVSTRENRAAHGNVTIIDACRCGATRLTNVNQQHTERGAWVEMSRVASARTASREAPARCA